MKVILLNSTLLNMIQQLRHHIISLPEDTRLEVFYKITEGYCSYCGNYVGDDICHCGNEE